MPNKSKGGGGGGGGGEARGRWADERGYSPRRSRSRSRSGRSRSQTRSYSPPPRERRDSPGHAHAHALAPQPAGPGAAELVGQLAQLEALLERRGRGEDAARRRAEEAEARSETLMRDAGHYGNCLRRLATAHARAATAKEELARAEAQLRRCAVEAAEMAGVPWPQPAAPYSPEEPAGYGAAAAYAPPMHAPLAAAEGMADGGYGGREEWARR